MAREGERVNKISMVAKSIKVFAWGGFLLGSFSVSALAEVVKLTAEFKPDPTKPYVNEFKNTTSNSGYCAVHPSSCEVHKVFSIATAIKVNSNAPIRAYHSDVRQGALFNVNTEWRVFHVKDSRGNEFPVEVRMSAVGGKYRLSDRVQTLIGREDFGDRRAHDELWEWGWGVPRKCDAPGDGWVTSTDQEFFWYFKGVECPVQARYDIPGFSYLNLEFGYQLRTPDPLKMPPGTYTGETIYTVGPRQDFDLGDIMQPTDNAIQLDFTLTVDDVFNIEIPPGGNRVELVPEGGWQAWLQQGRKPTRLFRDQTFNIWTSSPFKMQLVCEIEGLYDCMIRDPVSQRAATVQLSVSLPNGLTDLTGQPVRRRPLHNGQVNRQQFQPRFYVDRAPGILHFEISPYYVDYMLRPGEAANYVGNITVIWDSEV
jgi:hypothetical protein